MWVVGSAGVVNAKLLNHHVHIIAELARGGFIRESVHIGEG